MSLDLPQEVLIALESAFPKIAGSVGAPELTQRHGLLAFRYSEQTVEQALVQKAARVVSGLHAAYSLLASGHLQELRAIYRMLDEFGEDIVFLGDIIISGNASELHERFLKDFWAEEFDVDGNPLTSSQKRDSVPRPKIQAAIARQEVFPVNPSDGQKVHGTLAKAYSGYVHGASPHIMEMYGGEPARFHTSGMRGTPPHKLAQQEALNYFYRGLLNVIFVAIVLECAAEVEQLREVKDRFEQLTGKGLGDSEKMISKLKDGA